MVKLQKPGITNLNVFETSNTESTEIEDKTISEQDEKITKGNLKESP